MMRDVEYVFHEPINGFCKSHAIYKKVGNSISPMVYLRKPKGVTDEEFEKFINSLGFTMKESK
jgi:hypothetical protein